MQKLDDKKLENIVGGSAVWVYIVVASAIVFLSGVIKGYTHPEAC